MVPPGHAPAGSRRLPVTAPATDRGTATRAARDTRQTSSAQLTWALLLLVPVSLALALAARPIFSALLGRPVESAHASMLAAGSRMLAVFAPQIALYGLAFGLVAYALDGGELRPLASRVRARLTR